MHFYAQTSDLGFDGSRKRKRRSRDTSCNCWEGMHVSLKLDSDQGNVEKERRLKLLRVVPNNYQMTQLRKRCIVIGRFGNWQELRDSHTNHIFYYDSTCRGMIHQMKNKQCQDYGFHPEPYREDMDWLILNYFFS